MAHAPVSCTEKGRYEVEEDVIIDRPKEKERNGVILGQRGDLNVQWTGIAGKAPNRHSLL